MFCKYCGKQIDDDSTFCKHCGKSLVEKKKIVVEFNKPKIVDDIRTIRAKSEPYKQTFISRIKSSLPTIKAFLKKLGKTLLLILTHLSFSLVYSIPIGIVAMFVIIGFKLDVNVDHNFGLFCLCCWIGGMIVWAIVYSYLKWKGKI
jgi:ABC-type dipeptide/oligopeptide/nickel transport system permease component